MFRDEFKNHKIGFTKDIKKGDKILDLMCEEPFKLEYIDKICKCSTYQNDTFILDNNVIVEPIPIECTSPQYLTMGMTQYSDENGETYFAIVERTVNDKLSIYENNSKIVGFINEYDILKINYNIF